MDQKLYIGLIKFEDLQVPVPLPLPAPDQVERPMTELAQEVYRKYQQAVKRLLN